jgi:HlyD family secretion protein
MQRPSSPLVGFYERCLDWLRGCRRFRPPSQQVETVRVDLVGDSEGPTFGAPPQPKAPPQPQAPPNPDPGSGALSHPFRSSLATGQRSLAKSWSFNQTVLLSPRRRSSSVLVITAVGAVGAVGLWSITAPLAETIAVQGKLVPGSSTKRVDTPVPGVVEAVLVKEGQTVQKGDPLVRFDLRDPRSKLAAAEDVRARFELLGIESATWSPAEFDAFVRRENALWRPLIRELGIKLDS